MIKKLLALAAGAVFSLNASAGYIQYNFADGPVTGYFIQHDDDRSIADYFITVPLSGFPTNISAGFTPTTNSGAGIGTVTAASTSFLNDGPTNFTVFDNVDFDNESILSIHFSMSPEGKFSYTGQYSHKQIYATGNGGTYEWLSSSGTVAGLVTQGAVDPGTIRDLDASDGYENGVTPIIPTYVGAGEVPEPASLALLAIGALGAAGAARRRKAVR